ncbi:AfsR/SARP family transcriptional regulator [Streptomyces ipomoeae]|uniref:Transcriptional regulatory protein, C-terminal domain protein n=2 Tax=Streptomyces ipomoeae TaxID=103232 RepID=L1L479_9ACTN|nr:transcriptional regulatory protein, C-terminal domain protein [Streptomyces ipomoeae 91-03]TQE31608.1 AfsR/SARP family transcriptional regulator [Streptomyces ipomoeae]TQE37893.1 AfsR/SARP family transcriptional regulator [Streptomyces ipomoeae]
MVLEFAVLGRLGAYRGGTGEAAGSRGEAVDLGTARQRAVLAALLVNTGSPVTVAQLIDRVWADRPPKRGADALYTYLSRLRRVLGDDAGIVRGGGGFVLTVEPCAVDLHRFHELLAEARRAADPATAAGCLERALAVWRGEPFAGLDTPWFNALRVALESEHHVAQLDLTDLRLCAGRHGEVLSTLCVRTAEHPLDERLAGQLMLALAQSGRTAEALEHYRTTRDHLREELGIDPGLPLRRLHEQILTGEVEPLWAPLGRWAVVRRRGVTGRRRGTRVAERRGERAERRRSVVQQRDAAADRRRPGE